MILANFLDWAQDLFTKHDLYFGHGTDNAWDEAVSIAIHVLDLAPDVSNSVMDKQLSADEVTRLQDLAWQRVKLKKPLPYILGEAWFAGKKYYIDERVIIPRSPIFEIIHDELQPWLTISPKQILDLATGSGCLAIECAYVFGQEVKIIASDISKDALQVAQKNIELHNVADQVTLLQSDVFTNINIEHKNKFDIIISNPPYVGGDEFASLPVEFTFEPKAALLAGQTGFEIVDKILAMASEYLTDNGILIVEVGNDWQMLEQLYPKLNFTWLCFANGGEGVFLLTKQQLISGGKADGGV